MHVTPHGDHTRRLGKPQRYTGRRAHFLRTHRYVYVAAKPLPQNRREGNDPCLIVTQNGE
jgi:hypothetical protein